MSAEPTSQKIEQAWETPAADEIVELTKSHVAGLETTDDDSVWVLAGMHHVVLHTIGRKSGTEHKVALPTWNDRDGHRIVVASFAGAVKHPSWYINMRDREANPRVKIRTQSGLYWSDHELLVEGAERDEVWEQLLADRAWYADYQARTDRTIPLVRLPTSERIEA